MEEPLVSIIMPAYNAENFIEESVSSIVNQTYKNWELIIINDGSTDITGRLMRELATRDSRIIILKNDQNKGLVYTRNCGLERAKGKYVANLDSDDVASNNRLAVQVQYLEKHLDCVLLGSACETIDITGHHLETISRDIDNLHLKSLLVFSNYFINSTVMFRKDAIKNLAYQDGFAPAEDYQFFTQLMQKGNLANLNKVLVKYRIHDNNISNIKRAEQEQAVKNIHHEMLLDLDIDPSETELEIHSDLVNEEGGVSDEDLVKIEVWLLKLQASNNLAALYDKKSFDHFCAFFYRRACQKAVLGLPSYNRFKNSILSQSLIGDFKGNTAFFIKSILKRK